MVKVTRLTEDTNGETLSIDWKSCVLVTCPSEKQVIKIPNTQNRNRIINLITIKIYLLWLGQKYQRKGMD